MKHTKISASVLGVALVSGALVAGPVAAEAATKIKTITTTSSSVSKTGKLVSKKTGKAVKGYASFKGKVYKNGVKFTGVLNSKYYKSGSKATALYKGKYYKKGSLATASYKNIYYVKGKVANGVFNKKYYSKGKLATGVYKNTYYAKGNKATAVYKNLYYVKGMLFTGEEGNVQYVKGVNKGAYEIESLFVLRKYYIINQASELPKTVVVLKSDGKEVEQEVTWVMDEKDQASLTIKEGILTATAKGEYVLTGTVANSKNKQKLNIVIADADETFASINSEIEELIKFEKLIEEAKKKNEKVQTSATLLVNQSSISELYLAYFDRPADSAELAFWERTLRPNLNVNGISAPNNPRLLFNPPTSFSSSISPKNPGASVGNSLLDQLIAQRALNGVNNAQPLVQSLVDSNSQLNPGVSVNQFNAVLNQLSSMQNIVNNRAPGLVSSAVTQTVRDTILQGNRLLEALNNPAAPPVETNPNPIEDGEILPNPNEG